MNKNIPDAGRRSLKSCTAAAGVLAAARSTAADISVLDASRRPQTWNPKDIFPSLRDDKTAIELYNLTPGGGENQVIYQTHPMWTKNMEHLVFSSKREGSDNTLWMLEMKSGELRPVPVKPYSTGTLTWKNNNLYYITDRDLYVVDLVEAFHGEGTPKRLGHIPEQCKGIEGTVTVDTDLSSFYFGGTICKRLGHFAMDNKTEKH